MASESQRPGIRPDAGCIRRRDCGHSAYCGSIKVPCWVNDLRRTANRRQMVALPPGRAVGAGSGRAVDVRTACPDSVSSRPRRSWALCQCLRCLRKAGRVLGRVVAYGQIGPHPSVGEVPMGRRCQIRISRTRRGHPSPLLLPACAPLARTHLLPPLP